MARTTAVATRATTQVALPAEIEAAMAGDIAKFQERLNAPSSKRIAVTQDRKFKAPDGTKYETLTGVIVDFISKKSYYTGTFDKDNIVPPACFALDFAPHNSLVPSDKSPVLQSEEGCANCPKNAWGSDPSGRKGKACKDGYVLAILPPDADAQTELMTIEISATAIKPFDKLVRDVAQMYTRPLWMFQVTFGMDDSVDYASVRVANPTPASAELIKMAFDRREDAAKLLLVEPDVSDYENKVASKGKKVSNLVAPKARPPARGARV